MTERRRRLRRLRQRGARLTRRLSGSIMAAWDRSRRPGGLARVSVIVPLGHSEQSLSACLTALLAQTHRRLQVIVVDPGSAGAAAEVARRFARDDRRLRVVPQLGPRTADPRETGLAYARGEFCSFADPAMVLRPTALATLVETLVTTGSDFAVADPGPMPPAHTWLPPSDRRPHAVARSGVRLAEWPEVLNDTGCATKLFRRAFFAAAVGGFPSGPYADDVVSAKAYARGSFDLLAEPAHPAQANPAAADPATGPRPEGTSGGAAPPIAADAAAWAAWLDAAGQISAALADEPSEVRDAMQVQAVGRDLPPLLELIPRADPALWSELGPAVAALVGQLPDSAWQQIPIGPRLLALAAAGGDRGAVQAVIVRRDEFTRKVPGRVIDLPDGTRRPALGEDYVDGLGFTPTIGQTVFAEGDTVLQSVLTGVRWAGERLEVDGYAYLSQLDLRTDPSRIEVTAVDADAREVAAAELSRSSDVQLDVAAGDPWNAHADSAFTAAFDLGQLDPGRTWTLTVRVEMAGFARSGPLGPVRLDGRARGPQFGAELGAGRWVLSSDETGVRVRHEGSAPARPIPVATARVAGTDVTLTLARSATEPTTRPATPRPDESGLVGTGLVGTGLTATSRGQDPVSGTAVAVAGGVEVRLRLPELPADAEPARRRWRLTGPGDAPVVWQPDSGAVSAEAAGAGSTAVVASPTGRLEIEQAVVAGAVDRADLVGESLEIGGWLLGPVAAEVRWHGLQDSATVPIRPDPESGRFTATVSLHDAAGGRLPEGRSYTLLVDHPGGTAWLPVTGSLLAALPAEEEGQTVGVSLSASPKAGALKVLLRAPQPAAERALVTQRGLRVAYRAAVPAPRDAVLLESFNGKIVGDSPLAIGRELQRRGAPLAQFWSVASLTMPTPAGTTPVLRQSAQWYELLASARYLVNNSNFPAYFTKRPHQRYLQTWHGTPLKRIGYHVPSASLSLSYRALMVREAEAWDWLLAQNGFAAGIFPEAFGYAGEVLTLGYPRNDRLVDPDGTGRAEARRRLGIAPDRTVALYAPTWRDNVRAGGGYGLVDLLDHQAVLEALPAGSLLIRRGHSNTTPGAAVPVPGFRDCSTYPDLNDLLLAADLLITDYSSVMFDFAVTGRPILFLVPDLDEYGGTTRGFYLDLAEIAPGPLCRTNEELVAALAALPEADQAYAARYTAFVDRFTPDDDGRAAARVVDAVFGAVPKTTVATP